MRIKANIGIFALVMFGHTTAAWAADYWVGNNGNDGAAGSQASPWATIQHAVDMMQPGDSVTVGDGSYAGFWMKNRQGDAQHRFTIRAQNPLGAKITGPSPTGSDPNDSVQLVSVSFAIIDGFDVTGAPRAGISIRTFGDVTGADTTDNVVQNCRSHDNGAGVTAGRHDGIFTGFAQNVLIQNNEVDHNSEHGIYVSNSADNPIVRRNKSHDNSANGLQINADGSSGGDGIISNWLMENNIVYANAGAAAINLDGATFGTLRNNLVYGNAEGGVALFLGDSVEASHDNLVVNNTVYDPSGTRFAIQIDNGADNNIVFNNVFWSAAAGMEIGSVNGLVRDYNVVSSYTGGSASAHESTPPTAQLFVNASANDFHPGLALIGQGASSLATGVAPSPDIEGNARPQAGLYDIGCFEHAAAGAQSAAAQSSAAALDSGSEAAPDGGSPAGNSLGAIGMIGPTPVGTSAGTSTDAATPAEGANTAVAGGPAADSGIVRSAIGTGSTSNPTSAALGGTGIGGNTGDVSSSSPAPLSGTDTTPVATGCNASPVRARAGEWLWGLGLGVIAVLSRRGRVRRR